MIDEIRDARIKASIKRHFSGFIKNYFDLIDSWGGSEQNFLDRIYEIFANGYNDEKKWKLIREICLSSTGCQEPLPHTIAPILDGLIDEFRIKWQEVGECQLLRGQEVGAMAAPGEAGRDNVVPFHRLNDGDRRK